MLRLIDVETLIKNYKFKFVPARDLEKPKYAAFSFIQGLLLEMNDWDASNEFTYQTCRRFKYKDVGQEQHGIFSTILEACRRAREYECPYIWIDYCCIDIDKRIEVNGSTLSKSRWYRDAQVCLVYLQDSASAVSHGRLYSEYLDDLGDYENCQWWQQSWTLPIILASKELVFYDREWEPIGTLQRRCSASGRALNDFDQAIQNILQIDPGALVGRYSLSRYSVATILAWGHPASRFEHEEEYAYSLAAILQLHLEPCYGEGSRRAFHRLLDVIMTRVPDFTLFAWSNNVIASDKRCGALPESPYLFGSCEGIPPKPSEFAMPITNKGIQVYTSLYQLPPHYRGKYFMCLQENSTATQCKGILLRWVGDDVYEREGGMVVEVYNHDLSPLPASTFHLKPYSLMI